MIFIKKSRLLKVLIKMRKLHIADQRYCIKSGVCLDGLCSLAFIELSSDDYYLFKGYLHVQTGKILNAYIWDTGIYNTERLEWLDEHIKLNR